MQFRQFPTNREMPGDCNSRTHLLERVAEALVTCPVMLYPATTSAANRFHMISEETGNRLKQQMVYAETGEVVEDATPMKCAMRRPSSATCAPSQGRLKRQFGILEGALRRPKHHGRTQRKAGYVRP
jgi:hypothetical protein